MIALFSGKSIKNGNSAFVDRNWNAYPDQWEVLSKHTKNYPLSKLKNLCENGNELAETSEILTVDEEKTAQTMKREQDFIYRMLSERCICSRGWCILDTLNLMPRIQNQIRVSRL
ncbi:MAG: hypothetical protein ACLUD2_05825 [Clostridium sp.]